MKSSLRFIARTGMFLALLIAAQYFTKPLGQLVTGSCVNLILAVSAMTCGFFSSAIVALCSPFLAFLFGIGPAFLPIVPAIAVGNLVYSLCLSAGVTLISKGVRNFYGASAIGLVAASVLKFGALYLLVTGVALPILLGNGTIVDKQVKVISASFGITQLFTALIGGVIAIAVVPAIRKALRRND